MRHFSLAITILLGLSSLVFANDLRPGGLPDLRIAKGTKDIAEAWFADSTTRYRHFVLGSSYEAASLVVRRIDGRELKLTLPDSAVFEDRQPRFADLDGDGSDEIVVVKADLTKGASLAVVAIRDGALRIIAETPPTGLPNTWRNPAGIADFDGDGRLDIAEVQMPHVLGMLRFWTWRDDRLVEIATAVDVSNHALGSPHLQLAGVADVDGDGIADLLMPSLDRLTMRVLSVKVGAVRELHRRSLPKAAVRDTIIERIGRTLVVRVGHDDGSTTSLRF